MDMDMDMDMDVHAEDSVLGMHVPSGMDVVSVRGSGSW